MSDARRVAFLEMAGWSSPSLPPLYARLVRELAEEPLVDELVDEWRFDVPLRLLGGLHWLVLAGRASWDDVPGALAREREFLRRFVAEQAVQTNEVQRSWVLLPCFLEVARRTGADVLDLVELGPSAGLNLLFDRYRYRYAAGEWGSSTGGLVLAGDERRPVPAELFGRPVRVRERLGIDRSPVDASTEDGARLLRAFVWAGQDERLAQLERALAVLRRDPPQLVRGDFVELLPAVLERRREGALTVVFQFAAIEYLSPEQVGRLDEALDGAGRRGPLAFVTRARHVDGLELRLWPGGERAIVGRADGHGAWLEWLAQ